MKHDTPRMRSSGSLFLKIMSSENAPDDDPRKTFQILTNVESAAFVRDGGKAHVAVLFENGDQEDIPVGGNCYLMNEAGETVARFGAGALH